MLRAILTFVPLLFLVAGSAQGARYELFQDGWPDAGTFSGHVIASDINGDGQINSFFGEVSAIEMSFSGPTLFPRTLDFRTLRAFVFDLDGSNVLGDVVDFPRDPEGIAFNPDGYFVFVGPLAFVGVCNGIGNCGEIWSDLGGMRGELLEATTGLMIVTPVPAPATLSLILPSLLCLGIAVGRRR